LLNKQTSHLDRRLAGRMPKKTISKTKVGNRELELSNLAKVLFPEDGIIKAELIEYYLKIAPTVLKHVRGRPLSLVRFPDGIHGESFFQKNMPEWVPKWIERVAIGEGEDKVEYAIAKEDATLVWLANMACIELHQVHSRLPELDSPDYIVWDLDPPERYHFPDVVDLALKLKELLENCGYHTFVKTTGGKGVHVVTPIETHWNFDEVRDAALDIAKTFIERNPRQTTLQIKKDARAGRVFIDIYRNRPHQTIVSAYSVRGRAGAPVSMPLSWPELERVEDPMEFNLRNAVDRVIHEGDAWEAIGAYATGIHTDKSRSPAQGSKKNESNGDSKDADPEGENGPDQENAATPESLTDYARKREFDKTPEPPPGPAGGEGNSFVLHRHHATRLHYDLRLETNGALRSYAVPKGLPPRPGIKRLAVNTEDHPLRYTSFEGTIPKGQYGAGNMWIYATGKYDILKQKKDGFYIRLRSPEINAEYRMINTRAKDWLLERLDKPQIDWLRDPIEPMLASTRSEPFDSDDYLFEVKWDGIRAMISLDEGELTIRSRRKSIDLTQKFPELNIPEQAFRATSALYDGEIVCLDDVGRPMFDRVIRRMQQGTDSAVQRMKAKYPAVCYLFDCLYLDGRPIIHEPLTRRREWLVDSLREPGVYRISEAIDEGRALFDAAVKMGLEGVMAKLKKGIYVPGKRTNYWLKIKSRGTMDCIILGFTRGKGDRESAFGALQLGCYKKGELEFVGGVGSGFDDRLLKAVAEEVKQVPAAQYHWNRTIPDGSVTTWVEPMLVCEVRYATITRDGQLREPVFVRMRPDKSPSDCSIE
ncbi:MAG: non-homologous end-joining DNA ligase, partial [Blastocatellia bacterium]